MTSDTNKLLRECRWAVKEMAMPDLLARVDAYLATPAPVSGEAVRLADKIEALEDDGSEGYPWSQDELDLMVTALRHLSRLPADGRAGELDADEFAQLMEDLNNGVSDDPTMAACRTATEAMRVAAALLSSRPTPTETQIIKGGVAFIMGDEGAAPNVAPGQGGRGIATGVDYLAGGPVDNPAQAAALSEERVREIADVLKQLDAYAAPENVAHRRFNGHFDWMPIELTDWYIIRQALREKEK